MFIWFWICIFGLLLAVFLHFKSVEHIKLQRKYGKKRGERRGKIYGIISGILESVFLVGLWISPQQRFVFPLFSGWEVPVFNFSFPVVHLMVSLPLMGIGAWLGITGVRQIGMEVAETHCNPKNLETRGVYSIVRHPQYLGWIIAHMGFSIFLSAGYSMLFTPMVVLLVYLISKREEEELIREFGEEYKDYQKKVGMFLPKF